MAKGLATPKDQQMTAQSGCRVLRPGYENVVPARPLRNPGIESLQTAHRPVSEGPSARLHDSAEASDEEQFDT